ncbi:cobalamin biosynthesis protein CobQ [Alphaproteobacteria bacterium KMM 3653]|uniref:Cobalamin biosynthesis protein CobQ n=1 Tax=Harenicola maris TaxID=2841044 RepID=A0AAP2G983_9RHOB|nr:cobalamin biosynthesis protein CobQ [Harenicola maris]
MNTPAHLIFGAAAFARPGAPWVTAAALAGGLAPDCSLYLMACWHLFVLGTDPQTVFGQLYFSDSWMRVFRVDNSFVLWGIGLGVALWLRSGWAIAFTGAALLHLAFDFPLHHDDGRPHFWPISDWVFESPYSYWDRMHHGQFVGLIEVGICLILLGYLGYRFKGTMARIMIAIGVITQIVPGLMWSAIF